MFNDMNALTQNEIILVAVVIGLMASFAITQTVKAHYRDHHNKQTMYKSDVSILGHVLGFFFTGISMVCLFIYYNLEINSLVVFLFSLLIGAATPVLWKAGMWLLRKTKPGLAEQFSGGK